MGSIDPPKIAKVSLHRSRLTFLGQMPRMGTLCIVGNGLKSALNLN